MQRGGDRCPTGQRDREIKQDIREIWMSPIFLVCVCVFLSSGEHAVWEIFSRVVPLTDIFLYIRFFSLSKPGHPDAGRSFSRVDFFFQD